MISVSITDYSVVIAFWLAFTRWVTILMQIPIFDNAAVPNLVKILTSLVVTFAFFPFMQQSMISEVMRVGIENFWFLTIFNAVIGLIIGFLVKSIMNIFVATGSVMSQQIGFGSVSYFDPTVQSRVGPIEKLIHWTVLIMIISTGALMPMFKGVLNSFFTITMENLGNMSQVHVFYQDFFKGVFEAAFLLATPIIFTNLILNLVMGIVARTIPQMNIIMVSFVVNIGIGLLIFFAISEEFFHVAYSMYIEKLGDWFKFI